MNIPKNIDVYLEKNGIKRNFLSKKTGITENALSLTFSGKRKMLADEYVKICNALGVSYNAFVDQAS